MQRGIHSTGVAQIWANDQYKPPKITKETLPAMFFFGKKENKELLNDGSVYGLMCHNRYATVGNSDNIDGAHPFETERYIGFHNGTLREEKYADHEQYLTDSEALWNDINERGFEEVLTPLYEESAFALAYYDKVNKKVGFVRNSKRPLSFACHQTRAVVYYSSDLDDLRYALNKNDVDAHYYTLSPWNHIVCDPRKLNFSAPEAGKKRTNFWNITEYKPAPATPPKKEKYKGNFTCIEGGKEWRGQKNIVSNCKICTDSVFSKKSVVVGGFGRICEDCDEILFLNYNIDTQDEYEQFAVPYYVEHVLDDRNAERKLVVVN